MSTTPVIFDDVNMVSPFICEGGDCLPCEPCVDPVPTPSDDSDCDDGDYECRCDEYKKYKKGKFLGEKCVERWTEVQGKKDKCGRKTPVIVEYKTVRKAYDAKKRC